MSWQGEAELHALCVMEGGGGEGGWGQPSEAWSPRIDIWLWVGSSLQNSGTSGLSVASPRLRKPRLMRDRTNLCLSVPKPISLASPPR